MKMEINSSHKNLVGDTMNDLLAVSPQYTSSGVPPNLLVSRLSQKLLSIILSRSGEANYGQVQNRARELIADEVKNKNLVRLSTGNYLHGQRLSSAAVGGKLDSDSISEEAKEEDGCRKDSNCSPTNFSREIRSRNESSVSGRTTFDEGTPVKSKRAQYLHKKREAEKQRLENLRNNPDLWKCEKALQKKRELERQRMNRIRNNPDLWKKEQGRRRLKHMKKAVQGKLNEPLKETLPNNFNEKCHLCSSYCDGKSLKATCKNCHVKAHRSCVEKILYRNFVSNWLCSYCKPVTRSKCAICEDSADKDMGGRALIGCTYCGLNYHRSCHAPPIPVRGTRIKNWMCRTCSQNPGDGNEERGELVKEKEAVNPVNLNKSKPKSQVNSDNKSELDFSLMCYVCHHKFSNTASQFECAECKYFFHTRCCQIRSTHFAALLGPNRRHEWQCDDCLIGLPRIKRTDRLTEGKNPINCENTNPEVEKYGEMSKKKNKNVVFAKNGLDWWSGRLRPISVGENQPPLGPIPDLSVPDVTKWSCADVESYFCEYFMDKSVGRVFVDQGINGNILRLLRRADVLRTFNLAGFKLDVIMDVLQHVKRLQLRVNDRRYIWADVF